MRAGSRAEAQCRVRVGTGVAFGTYNVFSNQPTDSSGQISWRCGGGEQPTVQIALTYGNNRDGAWRRLVQGSDYLRYNLYRDSARSDVWGEGADAWVGTYPGSGWVSLSIFARIPALQDAAAGTYTDTVTVVINF